VSFLNQAQRSKIRGADHDSIHSVSSIRSVMSSMSSLWTSLGLNSKSASRSEKQKAALQDDLKYLYSAFTKVPCLRLSPDYRAPLIAGYEEFPFDSAVPLLAFKNLTSLEILDVDFRQFFGWDRVADQIRSLTVRRAGLEDPSDLIINIVLDDMDKRRRRSAKVPPSPLLPWPAPSPVARQNEWVQPSSDSSPPRNRPRSTGSPGAILAASKPHRRQRSVSPNRPSGSRHGSSQGHSRSGTPNLRRSSGSSASTERNFTPRGSSSNLLSYGFLPASKWRFLRHLSLADNSLTTMASSGLSPLANTLQILDLSSNLFSEIPDSLAILVSLRALNLSNCMISSLHSLGKNPLPAITTLNLRSNRLSSLAGIERLLSLERIDLRENRITDPTEIARLTGIPNLTEVFVNRNPFTKTHANYRVTIFNLFRNTPGYTQDILIDGHPPSYSERKYLVARAPELPNVPVVKPRLEDELDVPPRPIILHQNPPSIHDPFYESRAEMPAHHRRRSEQVGGSHRRKKITRRRVVPIAQEDDAPERPPVPIPATSALLKDYSTTDDSTYGGSVDATPVKTGLGSENETPTQSLQPPQLPQALPIPETPNPTALTAPAVLRTGSDSNQLTATLNVDGDLYKQRIEALRNDFGSAWLSALSDETWDSRQKQDAAFDSAFPRTNPLSSPTGPVRSASQSIVSGARTLG
jgi:Leucine-rich repeat (LRR) protein